MKFYFLFNFLLSIILCSFSKAGVEVGNGGEVGSTDEKPTAAVISCQNSDNNWTKIEIIPEADKKYVSVMINNGGGWKSFRGMLEEAQESRDCCPPSHPASCGCDIFIPIDVTKVTLENESIIRAEFRASFNKGGGFFKTPRKNIQLSCIKNNP